MPTPRETDTPRDPRPNKPFRDWAHRQPDLDAALAALGLSPRTYQRLYSGSQPLPPALLREIADRHTDSERIARRLRAAADMQEQSDAR